jgi:hypothetical protein
MIGNSGHVYGFYVRVEGYNSKNISDITVRVIMPAPLSVNYKTSKLPVINDYLDEAYFSSSKLNFKFSSEDIPLSSCTLKNCDPLKSDRANL